jgi:AcrR family transcriptional regulator
MTVTDNTTMHSRMPRSSEDARNRLQHAALELFAEHGFDQTTAAQIAARAGVTERTFFRHFLDKKEVLFEGQAILSAALTEAVRAAPEDLPPLEVLHSAFASVTSMLEENRPFSEPRQHIIKATPALQEREVAKHAALISVVVEALQTRGIAWPQANLTAQIGLAVFSHAISAWFADSSVQLSEHLEQAFAELQLLAHSTLQP